jgi:glycosyltransferase involved in cell wall biosynthesis
VRVVISAYASDPRGASEALNGWYTAEGMAQLGHEVVVLTRPDAAKAIEARLVELGADGAPKVIFVSDHIAQSISRGEFGVNARYTAWQSRALKEARRRGLDSFDLVHHVSWGSITHPVGLAQLGPPLVLGPVGGGQFHVPEHESWMDGRPGRERYRRIYLQHLASRSPFARRLARSSSVVLATNPETAQLLRAMGAGNVREMLAEAPPDDALSPRRDPVPAKQLLWVARFLPRKGARLALQMFAEVLRRQPSARLRMVGDGPTLAAAKELARTTGLGEAVEFPADFRGQKYRRSTRVRTCFSTPASAMRQARKCSRQLRRACPRSPSNNRVSVVGYRPGQAASWSLYLRMTCRDVSQMPS